MLCRSEYLPPCAHSGRKVLLDVCASKQCAGCQLKKEMLASALRKKKILAGCCVEVSTTLIAEVLCEQKGGLAGCCAGGNICHLVLVAVGRSYLMSAGNSVPAAS